MVCKSQARLNLGSFVYIGYVDDAGSTGTQLEDCQALFQVVGGPIVDVDLYTGIEDILAMHMQGIVPENEWDAFEFHSCDMFHAQGPFAKLGQEKCRQLLQGAMEVISVLDCPILYGAVDKVKLKHQLYRSANPIDIAFRLYLESLEKWFDAKSSAEAKIGQGMLILDQSRKDIRHFIEATFREKRKRPKPQEDRRGISLYLLDDVYFGDSKNSVGVQMADICVYFISRHLSGKADSEGFYNIIRDRIYQPKVFPTEETKG